MNSDHAPTAEQQNAQYKQWLILKDCQVCRGSGEFVDSEHGGMWAMCNCHQNRIDELRTHAANLESELAIARDLIATMRARIEELEKKPHRTWTQYKAEKVNEYEQCAEASKAQLRAVSDALQEKLPTVQALATQWFGE